MKKVMRSAYSKEYTDYVCVDALGKLYDPDFVTGHFGQLLKKHNLKKIRFHDLRHSCASVLLAQGVPMKQIQEWLGHSDMSTTANIYSHLDAVTKADTGAAMSWRWGEKWITKGVNVLSIPLIINYFFNNSGYLFK